MNDIVIRQIAHWTGGGGRANDTDKKHYHQIVEHDGNIVLGTEEIADNVVTSDGDYAAHTLNLNTKSLGISCAGMLNAKESPFDPGPQPVTETAFEAMCKQMAENNLVYSIVCTRETNLTHAEVEPTLGVKQNQKWDFTRLVFKPELRGAMAIGDYMRERIKAYMGELPTPVTQEWPTLRQGMAGSMMTRELQGILVSLGYQLGKVDGIFGPTTKAAVMLFQSTVGLPTDGVVGPVTWAALVPGVAAGRGPRAHGYAPAYASRLAATVGTLRADGSKTIKEADAAQAVTAVGAGGGIIKMLTENMGEATEHISTLQNSGFIETILNWASENWYMIGFMCVAVSAIVFMQLVKNRRLEDHRSGKNLGR